CIDACDGVMTRLGFPRGLIRYASLDGIRSGRPLRVTPRIVAYTALLVLLAAFLVFLVASRRDVAASMLPMPGSLYPETPAGEVTNLYTLRVTNKTPEDVPVTLRLEEPPAGRIEVPGAELVAGGTAIVERPVLVALPRDAAPPGQSRVVVGLYRDGRRLATVETGFLAPEAGGAR